MNRQTSFTGPELIAQERIRQIEKEGWSKKHDKQHKDGGWRWYLSNLSSVKIK